MKEIEEVVEMEDVKVLVAEEMEVDVEVEGGKRGAGGGRRRQEQRGGRSYSPIHGTDDTIGRIVSRLPLRAR